MCIYKVSFYTCCSCYYTGQFIWISLCNGAIWFTFLYVACRWSDLQHLKKNLFRFLEEFKKAGFKGRVSFFSHDTLDTDQKKSTFSLFSAN